MASPSGRAGQSSSTTSALSASSSTPVTVQSLLQSHAGLPDPKAAALDTAVSERNTLSAQNAQLWKLIEKQRAAHTHMMKEVERVRGERDVYKGRLQGMGESTDALLKAHKEKERREVKEGSLRSAASHSHLKNNGSTSSSGHGNGVSDLRAHLVRAQSDDIPSISQRHTNNDSSWLGRAPIRERQGSLNSVGLSASSSQMSNSYLSTSQASSSTQLEASTSDTSNGSAASSVNHLPLSTSSQDARKPYPLSLSPVRANSLPAGVSSPVEGPGSSVQPVSGALSTMQTPVTGFTNPWASPLSARDDLVASLPSAPILLTPATPAAAGPYPSYGESLNNTVDHTLQPNVVIQSASSSSAKNLADTSSSSSNDLTPPRPHALSRESRVSLPEEAKRYFANLGESPMPSPQTSHGFAAFRSDSASPDKLSPSIPQRRSESPLKQVQTLTSNGTTSTASEQGAADRRATQAGDSSEFLDLDPDDTDSVNDSIDDRASAVDSVGPTDSTSSQAADDIGANFSRKDKKRAVVEDFPLPPSSPPVPSTTESSSQAQTHMQSPIYSSHTGDSSRWSLTDATSATRVHQGQGDEASSTYTGSYDPAEIRAYPSQSQSHSASQQSQRDDASISSSALQISYRALPLLATDLPYTTIQVTQSSIRPNDRGKDVLSFIINVNPGHNKESWNIEKLYSDVLTLDSRIRASIGKSMGKKLVNLPEGRLWRDHAPAKVDQRKAALELYLRSLIALPVKNKDEIIAFFTSGIANEAQKPVTRAGYKEGYLTKRGKNFGGWKTRFFMLQGPTLEYYESRGGTHLGSIVITNAQIGRQQRSSDKKDLDEGNEYRHAFLIIEAKKGPGGSHVRHVLCAESDKERDNWVELLVRYVSGRYNDDDVVNVGQEGRASTSSLAPSDTQSTPTRRLRKEEIAKGDAIPVYSLAQNPANTKLFQAAPMADEQVPASPILSTTPQSYVDHLNNHDIPLSSSLPISSPLIGEDSDVLVSAGPRANSEMGHYPDLADQRTVLSKSKAGNVSLEQGRKGRRRSMNPLKTSPIPERASSPDKDSASPNTPRVDANGKVKISGPMNAAPIPAGAKFGGKDVAPEPVHTPSSDRRDKAKSRLFWGFGRMQGKSGDSLNAPVHVPRAVFAVPLQESLDVAEIASLPAVVFRCIQYLEAKKAELEEGIYRLSGSSAVIKALKDRFNNEGDVDLLGSDECWDPHAISGLLKTYLRELPASILTRDLHLRFLAVIDFVDPQERIYELSQLIAALPIANYSLLRALTAHLILIVQNANVNKMNMRNVGIVFSPTLGIPAGVFSLMLGEFKRVFNVDGVLEGQQPEGEESEAAEFSRRNSKRYSDAAADELLGLSGRTLTAAEEGQSDEGEEFSVHDESETEAADNTENESIVESSATHGSAYAPQQPNHSDQHLHPSDVGTDSSIRSRASHVAASRGLNISVSDKASRRHSRMIGLPHSPRPAHAPSPHSPHTPQKSSASPGSAQPSPLHNPR